MVLGCVSAAGVGNLAEITQKMDANYYVDNLLANNLDATKLEIQNFVFQSDNDPIEKGEEMVGRQRN